MRISDWSSDVCSSDLMNIAPGKPLPLLIQGAGADDLSRLAKMKSAIEFLARVESPRVLSDDEAAPQSATALLGTTKLLVPMAGLIDKDAELARLAKQIAKLESDLEKTATRIANPNFGKAPPAVQEQAHQHQRKLAADLRSEEHTSELQSLMRISYAVFCLKKKNNTT